MGGVQPLRVRVRLFTPSGHLVEGRQQEQEQDKELGQKQEQEDITREQLTYLTGLLAKEVSPSCVETRVAGLVVFIQQYREQQVLHTSPAGEEGPAPAGEEGPTPTPISAPPPPLLL